MRLTFLIGLVASFTLSLADDASEAAMYSAVPWNPDTRSAASPSGKSIPHSAADPAYNKSMQHFNCGTHASTHGSPHFMSTIHALHTQQLAGSGSTRARMAMRQSGRITVPLHMHIVSTAANAGVVTQSMVQNQFNAMNSVYNAYNIYFTLASVDYTTNDAWAIGGDSGSDSAMKAALRKGTYSELNIYFQTDLAGGLLGFCSLPTNVGSNASPSSYVGDGCNVAAFSMPGGPIMGYNMGMTAVHETGHWLGLLHTFEGYSCTGNGDYVSDTPFESQSTNGCPTAPWKNTCPRPAGFFATRKGDPIRNYMDYSIDSCYAGLTAGQVSRINSLFNLYRKGN